MLWLLTAELGTRLQCMTEISCYHHSESKPVLIHAAVNTCTYAISLDSECKKCVRCISESKKLAVASSLLTLLYWTLSRSSCVDMRTNYLPYISPFLFCDIQNASFKTQP